MENRKMKVNALIEIEKRYVDIGALKLDLQIITNASEFRDSEVLELFDEKEDVILVPRVWGMKKFGLFKKDYQLSNEKMTSDFGCLATFTEEQERVIASVIDAYRQGFLGGIVQAPPGWGKTIVALEIARILSLKTLIKVHREFLAGQWIKTLQEYFPNVKIGKIQQDIVDYKDKDVVVTLIQSHLERMYEPEVYSGFGIVIYDECPVVGAKEFSKTVIKFNPAFRLGLSATPKRKDGADNMLFWHIGDVIARVQTKLDVEAKAVIIDTEVEIEKNDLPRWVMLKILSRSSSWNNVVASKILEAVKKNRRVLVFSERLNHIDFMISILKCREPNLSGGKYIGGKTEEELEEASASQIIFATYQMAERGLNLPILDTVVLATPPTDVKQAVGRIFRGSYSRVPVIVDFWGGNKTMKFFLNKRIEYYKSIGIDIIDRRKNV